MQRLTRFFFQRLFVLLLALLIFEETAPAQTDPPQQPKAARPLSLLIHAQYGYPLQYVSEILYQNFHIASLNLSLEKECGLWPFFGNQKLVEVLLLELRLSRIWGEDIPLLRDQVSPAAWEQARREGRGLTADWDHYQIGLTPFYRIYYPLTPAVRIYGEAGLGLTMLDKPLIEDGTRWNFLLTGGLGLDCKIKNQNFYSFVRFEHFSNGGKLWREGFTDDRVIGPETIVFGLGMRFSLNGLGFCGQ